MFADLRILTVEDSEDDAALLGRALRLGGYQVTLRRVESAADMTAALQNEHWDLVICDYSMPHFSGIDALKLLRSTNSEIPFIFVSGTIGEDTAVAALKLGAQDYVMKDNLKRLVPAVQRELEEASLRRERKDLAREVQRLQKFEAIARLSGGIAHDFNNALGVILGWAEMALDETSADSPIRQKLQHIVEQAQHSAALTSHLLALGRGQVLQSRDLDLNVLVHKRVSMLHSVLREHIEIEFALSATPCVVRADPSRIEQVLVNLCLNARDAMPNGGRLRIETQGTEISEEFARVHSYAASGLYMCLSISDTGVGMDSAILDHIFEPYFTTKGIRKGTGLGLATVYGIVKQHGGFVNVYSEPGRGTSFRVHLPGSSGTPEIRLSPGSDEVRGGTETILVAEDHESMRELAQRTLTARGYRVIVASTGLEAIRLFEANEKEIRLVVLDVVMPGLTGPDAYTQMLTLNPDLPAIFTSGYALDSDSLTRRVEQGATFLQKPYSPEVLARAIRTTLEHRLKRAG